MRIRRKPRPGEQPNYLAHSLYAAELGAPDPGHYRWTCRAGWQGLSAFHDRLRAFRAVRPVRQGRSQLDQRMRRCRRADPEASRSQSRRGLYRRCEIRPRLTLGAPSNLPSNQARCSEECRAFSRLQKSIMTMPALDCPNPATAPVAPVFLNFRSQIVRPVCFAIVCWDARAIPSTPSRPAPPSNVNAPLPRDISSMSMSCLPRKRPVGSRPGVTPSCTPCRSAALRHSETSSSRPADGRAPPP